MGKVKLKGNWCPDANSFCMLGLLSDTPLVELEEMVNFEIEAKICIHAQHPNEENFRCKKWTV